MFDENEAPINLGATVLTKMMFTDTIPSGEDSLSLHPGDQIQLIADGGDYFRAHHAGSGRSIVVDKDHVQLLPRQTQPMNTADAVANLLWTWEKNPRPQMLTDFYGEHLGPHLWEKWAHTYNRNTLQFYIYMDLATRRQFIKLCTELQSKLRDKHTPQEAQPA